MEEIKPTKIYDIIIDDFYYDSVDVIPYEYLDDGYYENERDRKEFTIFKYKIKDILYEAV